MNVQVKDSKVALFDDRVAVWLSMDEARELWNKIGRCLSIQADKVRKVVKSLEPKIAALLHEHGFEQ